MEGKQTPEITAALKLLNQRFEVATAAGEKAQVETFESLQDAKVYSGDKVALVISDYRKFEFSWKELGLARSGKSPLPDNTLKQ